MAREIVKPFWTLFSAIFLIYLVNGAAQPQVPCYFIFGDSLSDNGNNNRLLTTAKANFPPFGIDFPRGPTGRFSNGRNLVDVVETRSGRIARSLKEYLRDGTNLMLFDSSSDAARVNRLFILGHAITSFRSRR
ncbi:hypothetical protein ACE6H2_000726 [Prunus campanulata]